MGTTTFVWDPVSDCVLMELDETDNVKAVYTNEARQYGGVLSQRRGNSSHYHHHDALGSTRFLTDSTGTVTDTYLNDAWGNSVASTGTTVNPFKWVGKYGYYTDNSTGQVYVRARMYQPTLAQWYSRDPLGFADGMNPYRYCMGNPITLGDPSGLTCLGCCCCALSIDFLFDQDSNPSTVDGSKGVGTSFQLFATVALQPSVESSRCQFQYWEWVSPNDSHRGPTECWNDGLAGEQDRKDGKPIAFCDLQRTGRPRPTDADWCEFMHPSSYPNKMCPGQYRIPIQDTPTIVRSRGNKRKLYFHAIIKSSPLCGCWESEVVWEGCQFIELDANSNPTRKEFHSGASNCEGFPEFSLENTCKK